MTSAFGSSQPAGQHAARTSILDAATVELHAARRAARKPRYRRRGRSTHDRRNGSGSCLARDAGRRVAGSRSRFRPPVCQQLHAEHFGRRRIALHDQPCAAAAVVLPVLDAGVRHVRALIDASVRRRCVARPQSRSLQLARSSVTTLRKRNSSSSRGPHHGQRNSIVTAARGTAPRPFRRVDDRSQSATGCNAGSGRARCRSRQTSQRRRPTPGSS